jgi:NAD(P)-dependent dehydrogenase (short-subunit alcohol dehydrogenase family)
MDMKLTDCVVVVTGGSSGIGLETARQLLQEGARVVICGRDPERLAKASTQLSGGDRCLAIQCDVLDALQVEVLRDRTLEAFGQIDGLVCNAGQAKEGNFFTNTVSDWEEELGLKFFSYIHPIRILAEALNATGAGSIVCVNSTVSTQPEPHLMTSSAARAGVLNLAKSLATAMAPAVRVNTVQMGPIESGQWKRRYEKHAQDGQSYEQWLLQEAAKRAIPMGRFGRPEEAASAIVYLLSPQSGYVTGARLEVSGGTTRHI